MSRSRKKNKYSGAKSWDVSCRNHGRCSYCSDGRQHFDTKARHGADQQLEAFDRGEDYVVPEGQ